MNFNVNEEYMDVAIIGMSGRFPGANSVEEFWNNLLEGKDSIKREQEKAADKNEGYEIVNAFGKVDGMYEFDNEFFDVNKREAMELDPQERKILEVTYEALEDAGVNTQRYKGKIGVVCGAKENDYALKKYFEEENKNILNETSRMYLGSSIATRIAYKLNLQGPCLQIKATCATALAAIHTAAQMLLNYEADIMLAGGVNLSLNQDNYAYIEGGITSKDGYGRAFSKNANGCVPGDGLGIIALKRLKDAKKDRDNIIAVIKGSSVTNDGKRKMGFTAPSIEGECETIKIAQLVSNVKPEEIDYIETHGTATNLGDMVEISALKKAFSKNDNRSIALGAVKNNVGHLNYAAGAAVIIKAAMVINHRRIPPVINVSEEKDELIDTPFYLNREIVNLDKKENLIRAGVSGFGIGGVNTHIILEEYKDKNNNIEKEVNKPVLLILSAKTEKALINYQNKILEFVRKHPKEIENTAFTLQTGRNHYEYCTSIIVTIKNGEIEIYSSGINYIEEEKFERNIGKTMKLNIREKYNEENYRDSLLRAAKAWEEGYDVDLSELYDIDTVKKISIPKYCFEKNVFNYFSIENGDDKEFEITSKDISIIRDIEKEQEKNEKLPSEMDYEGIKDHYEKIVVCAAANYLYKHEIEFNKVYAIKDLLKELKVIPGYKDFARYLFRILESNGYVEINNDNIKINESAKELELNAAVEEAKNKYPDFALQIEFIKNCVLEYDSVFKGEKEGNSVLYPDGKYDTILNIGANTPDITRKPIYINAFPKVIKHFITKKEKNKKIKILELGGGTGIITWPLLEELRGMNVEYYFTDIGKSFLVMAREKAENMHYDNVIFKQYNIEKTYAEQGFEKEAFDFIISMDVLQVSYNLEAAVNNLSGLLKKNGIFACVQSFHTENINYLSYGYAPGWWNYESDPLRKGKNIMLPSDEWIKLLSRLEYKNINIIYDSLNNKYDKFGFIFANRPDRVEFFEPVNKGIEGKIVNGSNAENNKEEISKEILNIVGTTIGEEIAEDSSLLEYGFDSLSLLIVSSKLKEKYHINVSVKRLYDIDTVKDLVAYIKQCISENETTENTQTQSEGSENNVTQLLDIIENL